MSVGGQGFGVSQGKQGFEESLFSVTGTAWGSPSRQAGWFGEERGERIGVADSRRDPLG